MKRNGIPPRVFTEGGTEVVITYACVQCHLPQPLVAFGLRKMPNGQVRNISTCKQCRGHYARDKPAGLLAAPTSTVEPEPPQRPPEGGE